MKRGGRWRLGVGWVNENDRVRRGRREGKRREGGLTEGLKERGLTSRETEREGVVKGGMKRGWGVSRGWER
jgi:hypothetical protein